MPILPLPKPQCSSRFPVNCNRTSRKKKKPTKGRMTLRGRSVICPGLLPSRFRGPTGNLPLFDSAWLSGARMLDARTGEGSEERRRGADAWAPLLSSAAPPGFWAVLQEIGPGFDALPGFWAVFPALRRGPHCQPRHNPRSEASVSSMSSSAAYETAQTFARAIEATCWPGSGCRGPGALGPDT